MSEEKFYGVSMAELANKIDDLEKENAELKEHIKSLQQVIPGEVKELKERIQELENKLAIKCEYHVDYGSDTDALIDELKSDLEKSKQREKAVALYIAQEFFDYEMGDFPMELFEDKYKEALSTYSQTEEK